MDRPKRKYTVSDRILASNRREVNEGKKHEISIKETKPLLGAESAT